MDSPRAHFFLAGDGDDLVALRGITGKLPVDAYGQILIEVDSTTYIHDWPAPDGVVVNWLVRGPDMDNGDRIAAAVDAWVTEWIIGSGSDTEMPYVLWVGCSGSIAVQHLLRDLSDRIDDLHLHHG